jgi:soluble lytic murein transglycosylase-like protein
MPHRLRLPRVLPVLLALGLAACAAGPEELSTKSVPLHPGETAEIRALVDKWADHYAVPRPLVHKVIQRESDYRPAARNGPYWGMMQILPATARGMGFDGAPPDLLDPDTNLKYAVRYLRGAWMVSDGDMDEAVMWYARGYYYEARDRCLLVETALRTREVARHCRDG